VFGQARDDDLAEELAALRGEVQDLRRHLAEVTAAHDEAIELALVATLPNGLYRLIVDARAAGWTVTCRRSLRRDCCGEICFEHPDDPDNRRKVELPLLQDAGELRRLESSLRSSIGWVEAA
jgi:hypothetical protein